MAGYDDDDDNRQNQDDGGYYQDGNDAEPSSYRTPRSSDGRYNQLRPRYRNHGDWSSDVDDLQLPQPLSRQPPRPPPHIYLPGPPQPPPHGEFPRRDQPPRPPPHRQATGRDQPPRPPPHRQFTSLARSQQQPQPQPQMPLQSDTWFAEPAEPSPHPQVSGFDYAFAEEQRRRDEEQDRHHQRIMRRVAKVERELRDHFSNMRSYDFESVMARGAYGVTCRIIERSHRGLPRRLIIKRALSTQGVEGLKHEIMVMQVCV
ncbi:hypothetical protein GGR50DRAFT_547060 [Xylaria sp. CBS 124048]|nr:hypothetical protein GGR50DRAFT_547060 [Xylaria sp. CBS 124048]